MQKEKYKGGGLADYIKLYNATRYDRNSIPAYLILLS